MLHLHQVEVTFLNLIIKEILFGYCFMILNSNYNFKYSKYSFLVSCY